jgi:hypothetical protein
VLKNTHRKDCEDNTAGEVTGLINGKSSVNQGCRLKGAKNNEKNAELSFQQYVVMKITEAIFTTGIPSLVNLTSIKRFPLFFF